MRFAPVSTRSAHTDDLDAIICAGLGFGVIDMAGVGDGNFTANFVGGEMIVFLGVCMDKRG